MDESKNFPVDGELLRLLPKAGATFRNPDVKLPTLRSGPDGYYIEVEVKGAPNEPSETVVTRRLPLGDNISEDDWKQIQIQFEHLDFKVVVDRGVSKGLEQISDERLRRLIVTLLTFLNPRQVAILIYLYREAKLQTNGRVVTFLSNDLLESLGYSRTSDGCFHQYARAQLNRDLVALHRVELLFAESYPEGDSHKATLRFRYILRIQQADYKNLPYAFDPEYAADYTYELADSYTVELGFFEGPSKTGDYVLFPSSYDFQQTQGSAADHDYRTRLITYLANRLAWDKLDDDGALLVSRATLLKNLGLLGKNQSRNCSLLWRTIHDLQSEGFLSSAQEISGHRKRPSIQIHVNPQLLRSARPSKQAIQTHS